MRRRPHPSLALLSLTLLAVCLAACGDSGGSNASSTTDAATGGAATPDAAPGGSGGSGGTGGSGGAVADPYAAWPEPTMLFPYVYSPDPEAPAYAHVRWETETWEATQSPEAALYLRKLLSHYTTAEPEIMDHFAQVGPTLPPLGAGLVLTFAGDILWVGENWSSFAEPVAPLMTGSLRIGNLEQAVSPDAAPGKMGLPVRFNGDPGVFDNLPFDLLQLNNNHTLDADDAGAAATKAEAERRGFATTGVDTHATLEVRGERIAFLSYSWGVNRRDITPTHDLFIVPFGHLDAPVDLSRIRDEIAAARADQAKYVVVLVHWGYEFEHFPAPHFLQMARDIVSYGADVIVGQGPHVVQPAEICLVNHPEVVPGIGTCSVRSRVDGDARPRKAAVFYSLGNFTNDTPDRIEVETGILGRVSLDGEVTGLGYTPIVLRQMPVRVVPADTEAPNDPEVLAEIERLKSHLGASWYLDADSAMNLETP